jgi:transcription initiation factor IIE alpha subunit
MTEKIITADCDSCESTFEIAYEMEFVSDESPTFCPFCGEVIESVEMDESLEDGEDLSEYDE